jgi:AcrR family transcriptional regulator
VSPQPSNRESLIDGALRCLERLPADRVTARVIASEAGANLGSIVYHFGSKDALVAEAVIAGLDRWLADIAESLQRVSSPDAATRLQRAAEVLEASRRRHAGLVRNFIGALGRAQHDRRIRRRLAAGFTKTRPLIASLLGFGVDEAGTDAAGLVHSMFIGLLFQVTLTPALAIEGERLTRAQAKLRDALPRITEAGKSTRLPR